VGERSRLPNRKPWLGTAERAGPSEHTVTVEPVGADLYRHGEHYSDFNELRRAKARFAPRWDPRFASSRPGLSLARALPDLAKLVAGSSQAKAARKAA
jgi:lysylphosphatidylglycerol synthetase-like protein (DUF2156 family)